LLIITIISQLNYLIRNKKHQLALQEARLRAEELTKAKEQFLANMSHEIRTPMNAIMGFTNQLMKSELGQKQEEHVKIIKTSADHLLHVLNDVLDFSKLQSGKVALEQEPFSPKELFLDSTRLFEDMAAEKGLKLITALPVLPKQLKGDVYRVRQILLNLLSNAIKFTEKGQVKLSVAIKASEAGTTWLQVIVEDSGVGIPKKHQARIFEEFEQVRTGDNAKGTGLGLAISSMLTKLHGGNIRVKSLPGHGTSMILDLPFGQVTAEQTEIHKTDKPAIKLSGLRILIADDEPFNLKLLQAIFQNHAVKVFEKANGKDALALLLKEPFDIALLDLKMPGMHGWEVAEKVRQQYGPNQKTAMIALTATVSETEKQKSINAGFNKILRKPFEEAKLLSLIARLTKSKKEEKQTKEQKEPDEEATKLKVDFSSLSKMGDEAFVREMIEVFLKSSKDGVEKLQNSLEKEDREAIRNEVHKMLPPSRHLKITALVKVLERLHSSALTAPLTELKEEVTQVKQMVRHINDHSTDQ
jgi:signal transduction histidine kinase